MEPLTGLLVALGLFTAFYLAVFVQGVRTVGAEQGGATPTLLGIATGAVTNFFDTLGIGSFATTTTIFRAFKMVPDEKIPGTLNVGHTLPTIAQAFIYTTIIEVDFTTLAALIAAAIIGSWFGAGIVSGFSRRKVQIGMGSALLVGAALYALKSIDEMRAASGALAVFPGGDAIGLTGGLLVAGFLINMALGALMTLGIGLYAPCMIMIALLGMNPKLAFPIMMGSCAFLMPVSSARFVKEKKFDARAVMGLLLGGIPAVFAAAFIVKEMSLTTVRWVVVVVVGYTAISMLRAAAREKANAA
ncbi:MAG TPA: TSUP family transporter [Gemmatimonadaceae bacterium]|nr:TSUP family transporter [Gemmatimonadaceae bacterium]